MRAKRWLWAAPNGVRSGMIALGTLVLIAGREDIGKSTLAYTLVAMITRGKLPGVYYGQPKDVAVVATEDSWESVIVPRLLAAGCDLHRVYRIDVRDVDGTDSVLTLPFDLEDLAALVKTKDVALILLDPLLSRLSGNIDTHKQAEVQQGLEPILKLADSVKASVAGLIHVNKGASKHVLDQVMGSKGFTTTARQVIFVEVDDEDPELRVADLAKNNDGRKDFPHPVFRIEAAPDMYDDEGEIVSAGRLVWCGTTDKSAADIQSAKDATHSGPVAGSAKAAEWLTGFLTQEAEILPREVLPAGKAAVEGDKVKNAANYLGFSDHAVRQARKRLSVVTERAHDGTNRSYWRLP